MEINVTLHHYFHSGNNMVEELARAGVRADLYNGILHYKDEESGKEEWYDKRGNPFLYKDSKGIIHIKEEWFE